MSTMAPGHAFEFSLNDSSNRSCRTSGRKPKSFLNPEELGNFPQIASLGVADDPVGERACC